MSFLNADTSVGISAPETEYDIAGIFVSVLTKDFSGYLLTGCLIADFVNGMFNIALQCLFWMLRIL